MALNSCNLTLRSYTGDVANHAHDFHQLVLPITGTLHLHVNHAEGQAQGNQVAIVAAGNDHLFYAPSNNAFLVVDAPVETAVMLEKLPAFVTLDQGLQHYTQFLYQQCLLSQTGTYQTSEKQMIQLFLDLLTQRFGLSVQLDRRVLLAKTYLDERFEQTVSIAEVARASHLSTRQLNTLFKREMGQSPQEYLLYTRMERAKQLLMTTSLRVQQVAEKVGYTNLAAFSDRFKQVFGYSPRYFRDKTKEDFAKTPKKSAELAKTPY